MKHLLMKALLCLSSLLCIYSSTYGQTHYVRANSIAGVEVRQGGGENSICPTYSSHFSTNNTADKFYFTSMICQAAYVKLEIFNPTSGTIKVTLTTTYGVGVETKTIAAGSSSGILVIPYDASYNWKFESVATAAQFLSDTLRTVVGTNKYVFPKVNDIAVPANTNYRLKAGQTLSLGTLTADNNDFSLLLRPSAVGTQTVIVELYNASTNAIVGESNLTIFITQNCALGITSITPYDSKNYDIAITYNAFVEPYKWDIYTSAGIKIKTGTTELTGNNPGLKRIFIDEIPSGIYDFRLSSASANCGVVSKQFSYGNPSDVCTMNAVAVRTGNNFNVTIAPITGVTGVYYTLTNALDSVITEGIQNLTGILSLNFTGKKEGQYYLALNPANSSKICFQKLSLIWVAAPTINARGYLKKYNNVPDYYEMAGIGDYGGVKDAGTGWVVQEKKNIMVWQTYVKSLSNVTGAKALITFRQDSSSTSKHYSLAFEKGKIKLISRAVKGGQNAVIIEIPAPSESYWLRFERNANGLVAKTSESPPESASPVFSIAGTINNAFVGWTSPFWKGLYVSSGSSTTLASAEFHRFLGGPYTGTTATVDNTPLSPPIIASSNLIPTANASVTFTSNACKSGYLIQFYKNGVASSQGSPYLVNATFGDNYKAKCEKGTDKSAFSNVITFIAPSSTEICGITDKLKLGTKAVGSSNYNIYARIFNGKLWVTQSLETSPESFLVRAVNFLSITFTKAWTGTDYSCFEGQSTGYGGAVEPTGFITPSGYTLTTTADGAHIYTLGVKVSDGTTPVISMATPPTEIIIPAETEWNRFRPEILPSITVPTKLDPITGQMLPDKWFIWHSPFRNMFGYVANQGVTNAVTRANNELAGMRRLGIMAQLWNFTEPCLEANTPNADNSTCIVTTNQTTLNPLTEVIIGNNAVETEGETPDQWANHAYSDFLGGSNYSRFPIVNGKRSGLAWIMDGENGYTMGNQQKDVNALVNSFSKVSENFKGYVGNQYFAPNNSLGYMSEDFFAGNTRMASWWATANAGAYSGKANKDNPAVISIAEMGTYTEDMLPEGAMLKDQNGDDWFRISHFGTNTGIEISYKRTGGANTRHWAVQYGGITYKNAKDAHSTGHKHFISFKPTNQVGDGYMYSDENKAWHDNKWTYQKGLWGPEYYNNPNIQQSAGDTPLPPYMQEGGVILCMFEGADGIYQWNSAWNKVLYPVPKAGNNRTIEHQVDATRDRCPRDYYTYLLKGQVRLGQKYTFSDNAQVSFLDLVAETDTRYLLDQTEYSIDGGATYVKVEPLGWSKQKLPPVLMVVNDRLKKAFIYSQEAYNECSSRGITSVKVKYNNSIYTVPILSNNAPAITGYTLSSNVVEITTIIAPSINSSVTSPTENQSVTLTSSGCQTGAITKWYTADEGNYLASGLTYVVNATNGYKYYAKCVRSEGSSVASNTITFAISLIPINVFLLAGESNAGTRNVASTLLTGESGLRTGVRIWNNNTNVLEQLNIGFNNYFGENEAISGGWGMEKPSPSPHH